MEFRIFRIDVSRSGLLSIHVEFEEGDDENYRSGEVTIYMPCNMEITLEQINNDAIDKTKQFLGNALKYEFPEKNEV